MPAREHQAVGPGPRLVGEDALEVDLEAQLLGERRRHDHERQAIARSGVEGFGGIARHRRVVFDLELFLAVERFVEGALAAPGLDEIGDLDPEVVAHRVAAREHQVGAHALRRRGEEVVVKQAARGGIARDGHRGASGEQQGKPSQPNPHGCLR